MTIINSERQPIFTNRYAKSAAKGALLTSGYLSLSTASAWVTDTFTMKKVVENVGGKNQYIKKYALGMFALASVGAGITSALTMLGDNVEPKKSPKAV